MLKYNSFKEIPVVIKSHNLAIQIYKLTKSFPKEEIYGLTSQLRRSAISIPANIIEGFYRNTTKEMIQFLYNARGSTGETIYHLMLSKDLEYIKQNEYIQLDEDYNNVAKQLNGWINSLKSKIIK
jgi:four helix bundle protein